MSARAIVSGMVFGPPASKISKAGNPYASATVREGSGEATRWWKVFVFNEAAIEEILRFVDGEPIAVAGEFDAEIYAPAGGEARVSWRIRADAVLSAKKPKARKYARAAPPNNRHPAASPAHPNAPGGVIDDPLPF
jgi:single-stranded DNA-binding protein